MTRLGQGLLPSCDPPGSGIVALPWDRFGLSLGSCLLVSIPQQNPEVHMMLGEMVVCAAISPHVCIVTHASAVLPTTVAAAL